MSCWDIAELMRTRRFVKELGYRFSAAYPIYDRDEGNRIMYYMVHASDHEEAPALMVRTHVKAVRALLKETQLLLPGVAFSPPITSTITVDEFATLNWAHPHIW
jgi:hypothetical protein